MRSFHEISKEEIRDLLGKGWLTHDGMWFYNTCLEFGIETASRINKAAIASLAPFEMRRTRKVLGMGDAKIETFDELKDFMIEGMGLILPQSVFQRLHLHSPAHNVMRWEWEKDECFAYKGMKQLGVLDGYECGVIYRIECWLRVEGLEYEVNPRVSGCIMHERGECAGEFTFALE